ncbi:MAG: hypothetical protein V3T72_06750, partial [Thermoanaerobaculia bacterium]
DGVATAAEEVPVDGDDPDDPVAVETVETYDFELAAGSFYLGGLRFEIDPAERFLEQSDWLQIDAAVVDLPAAPEPGELLGPAGEPRPRYDLVYLRGWEQCVTSVEDSEFLETALGGPDTTTRIRRMRRAEVLTDVPDTCATAFAELQERLTEAPEGDPHVFDGSSCELLSKARLTVGFGEGDPDDPCKPKAQQGYLGANNQTLRVMLTAPDRFIWGFDNASPLYRVQVLEDDGELVQIKFLTLPRDQYSLPLAGQAVEILPWGALLPNQEKVAEARGHLATVATSFDPEEMTLTIARPVPAPWLQWLVDHPEYHSDRDPEDRQQYFYLRLWTGGSGDADEPDHPFTPGTAVELAGTGLELTWNDVGLSEDTWIIAARPNTPVEVVPWELLDAAPPSGPRQFFAPLALLRWTADDNQGVVAEVHDCRTRFRPLCEIRGCCTLTVGDGINSHGDFDDLQTAVDHLPFAGGQICVLPGQHRANVTIAGRRNVTIHGCGKQTRVVPRTGRHGDPIFRVVDSTCVTLKEMDLVALGGTAVVAESSEEATLQELEIAYNRIIACDNAVRVEGGVDVAIHNNRIRMLDKEGAGVAIFVAVDDGLIERNDVGVVPADTPPPPDFPEDRPDPEDPCEDPEVVLADPTFVGVYVNWIFEVLVFLPPPAPFLALGGIQIGGGSERVRVLENKIHGGAGNGVTLGGGPAHLGEPDDPEEPQEPVLLNHPGPGIIQ